MIKFKIIILGGGERSVSTAIYMMALQVIIQISKLNKKFEGKNLIFF